MCGLRRRRGGDRGLWLALTLALALGLVLVLEDDGRLGWLAGWSVRWLVALGRTGLGRLGRLGWDLGVLSDR